MNPPSTSVSGDDLLVAWLSAHGDELIGWRRHLHAHPELSYHEYATTDFIVDRLEEAGLTVRRLESGTGLWCDLGPAGELAGERLVLRADIDALAMNDDKEVSYCSQTPGVCHACGHDAHMAIMLGVASFFGRHPELVPGPVRVLFQPAEEVVPGGAVGVISEGALDGTGAVFGFHCDPKLDVGRVGLRAGAITSAASSATIELCGPGGHTARPEETVDMVTLAARIVNQLPQRVATAVAPGEVKYVFGALHAGDAANVIPTRAELKASVRTPDPEVWETLGKIVEAELEQIMEGSGADAQLTYVSGVPPVVNDHALIETVDRAVTMTLGSSAVAETPQSWGGDDFAWYGREVPVAYVRLGVHPPDTDQPCRDLHVGDFDLDESAIAVGVRVAVSLVMSYFAR
ncbi:MAG: N-acyl-L-amino acid amidohydrolase [Ilumatobacter coccineus]|uniref:N-acyl-L-amino acid amidohydrolase n=1 Tax=Ilumatobacter coccineus TaxID=467094 RepID=A0A2G6K995_9ACTN|nr:MAG: N-acyl-L-amino acid amidohydrolase [Ilumatobacter coccineus]